MRVRYVAMEHFAGYTQRAEVFLPERGIVLITGANGAGKSSIANALAVGGWAKMIRGSYPWHRGIRGEVELHADAVRVRRIRTIGDKPQLEIDGAACDTQAKGQPVLDRLLGPFSVWRKTRVFKSRDADQFSGAGDADRKKLIEAIVGNDRFDTALKACRDALRPLADARSRQRHELALCDSRFAGESKRLAEAREILASVPATANGASVADLRVQLKACTAAATRLREEARTHARAGEAAAAQAEAVQQRLARLAVDECPECERPGIPIELLTRLRREAENAAGISKTEKRAALAQLETLAKQSAVLDEEIRDLQKRAAAQEADARRRAQDDERRAIGARIIREAEAGIEALDAQVDALELQLRAKEHEIAVLGACEAVLGIKGVRAHILTSTLAGVERLTNRWLSLLSGGAIAVRLAASEEAITLAVDGAGGGLYEDCSDGQARIIDVSLLLGLGLVAELAHGREPGTTVLDEIFDVLDVQATGRACDVVRELSRDRCVLLISHSRDLERSLEATTHLHVERGKIYEV